jgi:hypothetical protein
VSPAREIGSNLDLFFTIDSSSTMLDGDKWDEFTSGFTRFLHSDVPDGVGIGAGYFPQSGSSDLCSRGTDPRNCQRCDPNAYKQPDVEIGPMPRNGGPLAMSLGQFPRGAPVIRPALAGGLAYASDYAHGNPTERVVEVLVAGGPPSTGDCSPDTISDCADAAGASNIKTYVVAFDYSNGPPLDPIARRGGGRSYDFDSRMDDISVRFTGLLDDLKSVPNCQYAVPADTTDWDKVNVIITMPIEGGSSESELPLLRVPSRDACTDKAWYYDDPGNPTRIIACDAVCNRIQGPPSASVKTKVGCPTLLLP